MGLFSGIVEVKNAPITEPTLRPGRAPGIAITPGQTAAPSDSLLARTATGIPTQPQPAPPGMFAEILEKRTGTESGRGFWRALAEDPETKIPFLGGVIQGGRFAGVIQSSRRLSRNDPEEYFRSAAINAQAAALTAGPGQPQNIQEQADALRTKDLQQVENYLEQVNRQYTTAGQVGRIVGDMPAFMIEFLATGGLKKLGEGTAKQIGKRLLKDRATSLAGRAAIGTTAFLSGAALRSAGLPQRGVESVLKRQLPKGITYGPEGEISIQGPGEEPWTSVVKGLGDHYIEILSEQSGEGLQAAAPFLGKALQKTPFLGKLLPKIQKKWLALPANKVKTAADFSTEIGTATGFNGVLGEIGEEFLGDGLRAVFDIDDFGAGKDAGPLERLNAAIERDIENLPVMAAAFAVPGVVRFGAARALGAAEPQRDFRREADAAAAVGGAEAVQAFNRAGGAAGMSLEQLEAQVKFLRDTLGEAPAGQKKSEIIAQITELEDILGQRKSIDLVEKSQAAIEAGAGTKFVSRRSDLLRAAVKSFKEGKQTAEVVQDRLDRLNEGLEEAGIQRPDQITAEEVRPALQEQFRADVAAGEAEADRADVAADAEEAQLNQQLDDMTEALRDERTEERIATEAVRETAEQQVFEGEKGAKVEEEALEARDEFELYTQNIPEASEKEIVQAMLEDGAEPPVALVEKYTDLPGAEAFLEQKRIDQFVPEPPVEQPVTEPDIPGQQVIPEGEEKPPEEMTEEEFVRERPTILMRRIIAQQQAELTKLQARLDKVQGRKKGNAEKRRGIQSQIDRSKERIKLARAANSPETYAKAWDRNFSASTITVEGKPSPNLFKFQPEFLASEHRELLSQPRGVAESAKSTVQKMIEAEVAEELGLTEGTPAATTQERTEEELTGLSKSRRARIKGQTATNILQSEIYQTALEGQDVTEREIDVGFYFVEKSGQGEIDQVIQSVPKGRIRTALKKMFTFDRSDLVKNGGQAISWDVAVQAGFERTQGTEGHLDLTEFAERVKQALEGKKPEPGSRRLNSRAMDTAAEQGEPFVEMMVNKFRMLHNGSTKEEINDMILDVGDRFNIKRSGLIDDMIDGDQIVRLQSLTDAESDEEIDRLAEQQVEAEDVSDAEGAAKAVLEANGIDVHIEQVEIIDEATLADHLPEKPDDDVPFEVRGKPTGAALTTSDRQIILLANGADSQTGYHEGYHVIRPRLTARDHDILARNFANEEAEAAAFGEYAQDKATQKGQIKFIFEKLMRFLRQIKSALTGAGFRTHEQIFFEIAEGTATVADAKAAKVQFERKPGDIQREAEKRARVKAKAARLKAARKPKVSKARLRIKLKDTTPFLRPDLRPLPEEELVRPAVPETKGAAKRFSEEAKLEFRTREKTSLREALSRKAQEYLLGFDRRVEAMSARLEKIHPLLMSKVRRYVFDVDTRTTQLLEQTAPFIKGIKKIKGDDARDLKYALNNNWRAETERLVEKYNLQEEYQALRDVLDAIHEAGNEVGLEILYRGDHFPRRVKDLKGLLRFLDTSDKHSAFSDAIRKRQEQAGGRPLSDNEVTQVVNTLLRGFRVGGVSLSRPGVVKDRSIEEFDRSIENFYFELDESLEMYIQDMIQSITTREFFGKQTSEIAKLRAQESRLRTRLHKTQARTGITKPVTLEKHKSTLARAAEKLREIHEELEKHKNQKLEDSIGYFALQLDLDFEDQAQVFDMLKAIMEPRGLNGATRDYVKLAYVDVLANIPVALTQLEELGLSVYRDNLNAIPAAHKALLKNNGLNLEDIGISDINQYMRDLGLQGIMDKAMFAMRAVDTFGKQTLLNTELARSVRLAKNSPNNAKFVSEMRRVFGDDARDVINDLTAERMTDNVKFLMFSKILDLQPSAITETPEYYAAGGNWRILYMLRQFTLKRMSVLRDKATKTMTGTPSERLEAMADLAKMLAILTAFGVGKDFIKDWYLGKDFDLADSVLDNMLQYLFLSRWRLQSLDRRRIGAVVGEEFGPPFKAIEGVWSDVKKGEINRSVRSIPIIGEEYYWWFGGGSRKGERNEFLDIYDPFN